MPSELRSNTPLSPMYSISSPTRSSSRGSNVSIAGDHVPVSSLNTGCPLRGLSLGSATTVRFWISSLSLWAAMSLSTESRACSRASSMRRCNTSAVESLFVLRRRFEISSSADALPSNTRLCSDFRIEPNWVLPAMPAPKTPPSSPASKTCATFSASEASRSRAEFSIAMPTPWSSDSSNASLSPPFSVVFNQFL